MRKRKDLRNSEVLPSRYRFIDHLQELRERFFVIGIMLFIATLVGFWQSSFLLKILIAPLHETLFYTSPAGGFDFVITVSIFFGIIVTTPVFIYQFLQFISPALPHKTKKNTIGILISSCILTLLGIGFAYYISLPAALFFLRKFGSEQVVSLISAQEYASFVLRYLVGFGILFQLPLVLLVINALYPFSVKQLFTKQRYVILVSFIIAAILTPTPDLINQTIMAMPIILLYQLSILFIWIVNKRRA